MLRGEEETGSYSSGYSRQRYQEEDENEWNGVGGGGNDQDAVLAIFDGMMVHRITLGQSLFIGEYSGGRGDY